MAIIHPNKIITIPTPIGKNSNIPLTTNPETIIYTPPNIEKTIPKIKDITIILNDMRQALSLFLFKRKTINKSGKKGEI